MKLNKLVFDKNTRGFILSAFDKAVDHEGYIVEKTHLEQRVLSRDGQEVKEEEFAGIRKGSEIFIKSDLPSLIQLCDELSK